MSIIIGSDIVLNISNSIIFEHGSINEAIDSEVRDLFNNTSYKIFNLEVPLTDNISPIKK